MAGKTVKSDGKTSRETGKHRMLAGKARKKPNKEEFNGTEVYFVVLPFVW
jgi:hypothetical protein